MKKRMMAGCCAMLLLCGCAAQEAPPATHASETIELPILGQPGRSIASVVLGDIWAQYEMQERFAVYGGMMEHPVPDAPGDLDLERPEDWAMHCRFPLGCLQMAEQGAAVTHLLSENLFTAVVIRVAEEEDLPVLAENWRRELQNGQWSAVAPERILLAQVAQRYLVMAMGSKEYIRTFRQKLMRAYPAACLAHEEPVTH